MKDTIARVGVTAVTFIVVISSSLLGVSHAAEPLTAQQLSRTEPPAAHPVASAGNLASDFQEWLTLQKQSRTDRQMVLGLGWVKGLSTKPTIAYGHATLDLTDGSVRVQCRGLDDPESCEVWLVDNKPGPGRSILPEPGDVMINVGALAAEGDVAKLDGAIGRDRMSTFQLDLIVVTQTGQEPARGLLYGAPTLFQRLSTRALAAQGAASTMDRLVAEGEQLFFNETFNGNSRTCGTCHPARNNLTIDPNFIATLPSDDPLFVAEFVPALRGKCRHPTLF